MKELSLKIDYWLPNDLNDYLIQLNGVSKVVIDKEQDIINILYDSNITSIYILKREVELFLEIKLTPIILGFDKHSTEKATKYELIIKDLCCEFCFKDNIEELLMINGIESAFSDYNYKNNKNVKIYLTYDNKLISKEEIIKLENKFNYE